MAYNVKQPTPTPRGIAGLLSGAQVNGGSAPSRESRNKVRVDQGRAPRRPSGGASTSKRSAAAPPRMAAELSQPNSFGQPFNM